MPKKKTAEQPADDGTKKFLVVAGSHVEADGTEYVKGDTVETTADLDVMFANKFQRVGAETKDPKDYDKTFDNDDVMDELLHEKDKPGGTGENAEDADGEVGETSEHGTDVSAKFKDAADADLVVFKTEDGTYNVADKDTPGKPLNKKPLPYNKVKAFIATQLGK